MLEGIPSRCALLWIKWWFGWVIRVQLCFLHTVIWLTAAVLFFLEAFVFLAFTLGFSVEGRGHFSAVKSHLDDPPITPLLLHHKRAGLWWCLRTGVERGRARVTIEGRGEWKQSGWKLLAVALNANMCASGGDVTVSWFGAVTKSLGRRDDARLLLHFSSCL